MGIVMGRVDVGLRTPLTPRYLFQEFIRYEINIWFS